MYLVKSPWWLKMLYPQLVWNKSRLDKTIYLTFDDGPIPVVTPWVLEVLKTYQAKATFFCIGDNIEKHPEVFSQLKADGHSIGNHTQNHLKGWAVADDMYLDNIQQCSKWIKSNLFRPPYGRIKRSQIKQVHNLNTKSQKELSTFPNQKMEIVMWDVLSGDFDRQLSPEKCLKNVLKHTENGSIIVFHDSLKAWERLEYVLPKALEYWRNEGYTFGVL
jgi:peptidoglycan/xylan/chitin deacetylase (PgdA/CDA1 family)